MARIGSNTKPVMIKGKRTGRILGDTGSWYKPDNKKKFDDNWDAIFNKSSEPTETKAQ